MLTFETIGEPVAKARPRAAMMKGRACLPNRWAPWHTMCKPKGPVLQNTKPAEVAAPIVKRGFVTPKFSGLVRSLASSFMVTGGMGISARTAARLLACFEHPVHPMCFKTQKVVSLGSPAGIQTMTATTQQASRTATPTTGTADPIQLHAEAHNALNMAAFYLRQPTANVPGARRKAIQALSALRNLSLSLKG